MKKLLIGMALGATALMLACENPKVMDAVTKGVRKAKILMR